MTFLFDTFRFMTHFNVIVGHVYIIMERKPEISIIVTDINQIDILAKEYNCVMSARATIVKDFCISL